MTSHKAETIASRLLDWHPEHQRDLPWRSAPAGERDPYRVWVSEVMSQQTRLETVVDYYERWMERFPTVYDLAAADQQEVLKLWEGLGYYARARNLHRAARTVVQELGGTIPSERKQILQLRGIGEYTAGAILSIAFGLPEPAVDGNVKRVLSRLWDIDDPIHERETVRRIGKLARKIAEAAPAEQAGTVNEGVMELGATICTPQRPRCLICPLSGQCTAHDRGTQQERPVRPPRKKTPHYDAGAAVIWQGEPFASPLLIARRPQDGLLGGLWEFPGGRLEAGDADLAACLRREIREALDVEVKVRDAITTVDHAYTHFRITLRAFHAGIQDGDLQAKGCADWHWTSLDRIDEYPFPVTGQKIIAALREEEQNFLELDDEIEPPTGESSLRYEN